MTAPIEKKDEQAANTDAPAETSTTNDPNLPQPILSVTKTDAGLDFQIDVDFFKLSDEKRLVGGIVYAPDTVDLQKDWATAEDIEHAAHDFMINSQVVGVQHSNEAHDTYVVESFIAPMDLRWYGRAIKKGTWCMVVKVNNDRIWARVKKGELTGFSMAGSAQAVSE